MDWEGLPSELLNVILGKLIELTDHFRFRSVCRSWRSAARSHPMPPSLPWLFLPENRTTTNLHFYSLSEDRIYSIPFPEGENSIILGSTSGFLLAINYFANYTEVMMINPFTGTRVHLPDIMSPFRFIIREWDYSGSVIMVIFTDTDEVVHYRLGDDSWKHFKVSDIQSVIYKAGSFYLLDYDSKVLVLDAKTLNLIRTIEPPHTSSRSFKFAMSPDDGIQLVKRCFINWGRRLGFELYKLDPLQENSRWSKITNISNNHALFHHINLSFLVEASRHAYLRNAYIHLQLRKERKVGEHAWNVYAYNLGDSSSELKGQCNGLSFTYPFWILPTFDTCSNQL